MSASPPKATVDIQNLFGREGPNSEVRETAKEPAQSQPLAPVGPFAAAYPGSA